MNQVFKVNRPHGFCCSDKILNIVESIDNELVVAYRYMYSNSVTSIPIYNLIWTHHSAVQLKFFVVTNLISTSKLKFAFLIDLKKLSCTVRLVNAFSNFLECDRFLKAIYYHVTVIFLALSFMRFCAKQIFTYNVGDIFIWSLRKRFFNFIELIYFLIDHNAIKFVYGRINFKIILKE